MSRISVIIPNYNGEAYIKGCLDSLKDQDFDDFEILVIDNCSTDKSADTVEKEYPEVTLKRLSENFGFSRAVNEGLRLSTAPYVILLNNDTRVEKSFVRELYEAVSADEGIFSASAKMLQMAAPDRIDGAGDLYCALGWAFARGKGKRNTRYEKPCSIFASCGGASIYSRKILDEIGWFDEFHFAYLEDVDIGYRARIMGYRNVYCPKARVYHAGSASSGSRYNDFKIRLSARNNMYIIMKNMPVLQIILNLPFLLAGFFIKAVFFTVIGHARAYLSGLKRGYILCREGRKYPYSAKNLKNYCLIQLELWLNIFKRIADFV
ncbi:MAG: glycosyltransferase family 2 protein [Lachnospiraceae bacterium]|nr:glycosyltransferase family 2 protein [Lachnospiraceae bacterium]